MKRNYITYFLAMLLFVCCAKVFAQNAKPAEKKHGYPENFTISKSEFDRLFLYKINEQVLGINNKFLNKSVMILNTKNGDMKFFKLKLHYFKNAFLLVQVNGTATTQVFILSDDKSVFYKGQFEKNKVTLRKCAEDDIVSE